MLRFHMKKKCINFGSYLDERRMHFNAMRKINCTENTIKLYDGTLAGKRNSADVFSLSQTTKSRKFTTERDKRSIKTANTVNSTLTFITLPYLGVRQSVRLVSDKNLRIHWFKSVS